jgi:hypothetical protein
VLILVVYLLAVAGPAFYARRGALARFLWIELALACLFFWAVISAQSIRWVSARAGGWGQACLRELRLQEEQGNVAFPEPLACERARAEAKGYHQQAEATAGLLLSLGLGCFLGAAVYRREERVELTRTTWSRNSGAPT